MAMPATHRCQECGEVIYADPAVESSLAYAKICASQGICDHAFEPIALPAIDTTIGISDAQHKADVEATNERGRLLRNMHDLADLELAEILRDIADDATPLERGVWAAALERAAKRIRCGP
jgi:hypothetical protein